jgi:uncharacterized protein (TIGR02270 family)
MLAALRQPIPAVVRQHAEDAAILRHTRSVLVRAPHVKLHHLARLDERIAAHLDGLAVAGDYGASQCDAALETSGTGEVFAAAVGAILRKDRGRLDKLFALAGAEARARRGLTSAFGWVSASELQGTVAELLASEEPIRREIGIAACAMHRVDPGAVLTKAIDDPDELLRARAVRAAGQAGRRDLVHACIARLKDEDGNVRFWAAASALLLGDRDGAVAALGAFAAQPGPWQAEALALWLRTVDLPSGHQALQSVAKDPANQRLLIWGAGIAGQAQYVPWLIGLMADDKTARLAGESLSMITGLDLASLDLERKPPEDFESGPTDEPEDPSVDMDPDESLSWPDQAKIHAWWKANEQRFQEGVRYFMGEPLSAGHCRQVLREGFQRQRRAAALYLCLLSPGSPPFPIAAPSWRQKRWLDAGQIGAAF